LKNVCLPWAAEECRWSLCTGDWSNNQNASFSL
jgi:hypothetical protein